MSALAQCLKCNGEMVIGSDKEEHFFTEDKLNDCKIPIFKFNKENINKYKSYIFIISHAYDEFNNEEVKEVINKNFEYYYYSDFINNYFDNIKIGIAGTHGKTTVTTMTMKLFENDNISYIIGDGEGGGCPNSKYLIFEACEYKYHFINYDYDFLIINNIDYDHPDYYNNLDEVVTAFKLVSKKAKCIIVNNDDIHCKKIKNNCRYTFGIKNKSFVTGTILLENEYGYKIKVSVKDKEFYFDLPIYGIHMVYNFLASFTIFYLTHYKKRNIEDFVSQIFRKYVNPKRRVQEIKLINGNILINDYAHHPNEIESSYNSIKQKYQNYDVTIVFQPHTYSRTIFLSKQFQDIFKDKDVYIANTFTAREEHDDIKEKIVSEIFKGIKKYDLDEIKSLIKKNNKQIIIFMGAGNIGDEIEKILKLNMES